MTTSERQRIRETLDACRIRQFFRIHVLPRREHLSTRTIGRRINGKRTGLNPLKRRLLIRQAGQICGHNMALPCAPVRERTAVVLMS